MANKKNWIQNAVNKEHIGDCTPITKSTCTPRRKAFAMTMKKHHGFHDKKEFGGALKYDGDSKKVAKDGTVSKSINISGYLPNSSKFDAWMGRNNNIFVRRLLGKKS